MRRGASGYMRNVGLGDIEDDVVVVRAATGDVVDSWTPNEIPAHALAERAHVVGHGFEPDPGPAAYQCGVPRIDWEAVLAVTPEEMMEFEKQHAIQKLLSENAKTEKPRDATKRVGKIVGMSLAPHYYPNLLNVVHAEDGTRLATKEDEDIEEGREPEEPDSFAPMTPNRGKGSGEKLVPAGRLRKISIDKFQAFDGRGPKEVLREVNGPGARTRLTADSLLTFCAGASPSCRSACLVTTGQHAIGASHGYAKMRFTYAFLSDPIMFTACLNRQLKSFSCECRSWGYDAVVRLNMLSDLPWYEMCPELFEEHDGTRDHGSRCYFYDYTKVPFWRSANYKRVERLLDLTFSFSGTKENQILCRDALAAGYRVAAVFSSANPKRTGIPGAARTTYDEIMESNLVDESGNIALFGGRWQLVDGDESDYRIDDPAPCVVALNFKSSPAMKRYKPKFDEEQQTAKRKFTVMLPETEREREYASAYDLDIWSKIDRSKLSREQVRSVGRLYEEASRRPVRGAKKLAKEEARKLALSYTPNGDGPETGEGTPYLESGEETLEMRPIAGTDLLIGPTVPTLAND